MKPYYQDTNTTIYCHDSLEVLQTLEAQSINLIITDPPYCSGAHESAKRGKRAAKTPESVNERPTIELDAMGSLGFDWVMRHWLLESRRCVKEGGHLACFIDWRMLPPLSTIIEAAGWRWNNTIVWDKAYPGLGSGFRAQHELILLASNGAPVWYSYDYGNVLKAVRLTKTQHPHQKPTSLINKVLETCSQPGDIVLDSFMGSGSTLVSAKQLGRKAIGIDLSEKYCQISVERLLQETLMFEPRSDNNANAGEFEDARQFRHCTSGQVQWLF